MDQLGQLKLKYQSVLNYIAVKGVRLANLHVEGGKLLIRGAAGTEDIKNDVWNQIKLVDANWASDLVCDLSLDPSLAPPQKTYTVKSGDTLWKIAQDQMGNGNLYKQIVAANGIPNENLIHPGDVLVIPDAAS
jgi:nucleoid-associated protein YgaU